MKTQPFTPSRARALHEMVQKWSARTGKQWYDVRLSDLREIDSDITDGELESAVACGILEPRIEDRLVKIEDIIPMLRSATGHWGIVSQADYGRLWNDDRAGVLFVSPIDYVIAYPLLPHILRRRQENAQ